jgi:hypothetical protein
MYARRSCAILVQVSRRHASGLGREKHECGIEELLVAAEYFSLMLEINGHQGLGCGVPELEANWALITRGG